MFSTSDVLKAKFAFQNVVFFFIL